MLVETVSANPREPDRFEAVDQNRPVASSLETRCHYSSFMPHILLSVLPPKKLRERARRSAASHERPRVGRHAND